MVGKKVILLIVVLVASVGLHAQETWSCKISKAISQQIEKERTKYQVVKNYPDIQPVIDPVTGERWFLSDSTRSRSEVDSIVALADSFYFPIDEQMINSPTISIIDTMYFFSQDCTVLDESARVTVRHSVDNVDTSRSAIMNLISIETNQDQFILTFSSPKSTILTNFYFSLRWSEIVLNKVSQLISSKRE